MAEEFNPFQPPSAACMPIDDDGRQIVFRGCMTLREFDDVQEIKRSFVQRVSKVMAWTWFLLIAVGGFAYAIYVFLVEGFDDFLPSTFLGLGLIVAVPVICFVDRLHKRKQLESLRSQKTGIFSPVRGEIGRAGILFATGRLSLDYGWESFVGYRSRGDVIIVYTDFPSDLIVLAASWFSAPEEWTLAKARIEVTLQPIGMLARHVKPSAANLASAVRRGIGHINQEEWDEAQRAFDEALRAAPTDLQALRGRARAIAATADDPAEVLAAVNAAMDQGAQDTVMLSLRAQVLIYQEQYERALTDYDELLRRDPDEPESLRDRGLVLLKLGRFAEALRDTNAAVAGSSGDAIAFNNRGVIHLECGRLKEAIADLELAIRLKSDFANPHKHLARARAKLGLPVDHAETSDASNSCTSLV